MPGLTDIDIGHTLPERTFIATNVSLFLYNAAIWNPHRIHYDERYVKEVEHHPGIVIDGPLQGDWLTQAVFEWIGDNGEFIEFEYSNRKASYLGDTLTSGAIYIPLAERVISLTGYPSRMLSTRHLTWHLSPGRSLATWY